MMSRKIVLSLALACGSPTAAAVEETGELARAFAECAGVYEAAADWLARQKGPRVGGRVYGLVTDAEEAALSFHRAAGASAAQAAAFLEQHAAAARGRMEDLLHDGDRYAFSEALNACAALKERTPRAAGPAAG